MSDLRKFLEDVEKRTRLSKETILETVICHIVKEEVEKGKIPTVIFINNFYKEDFLNHFNTNIIHLKLEGHFSLYNIKIRFFDGNKDDDYYIGYNIYDVLRELN